MFCWYFGVVAEQVFLLGYIDKVSRLQKGRNIFAFFFARFLFELTVSTVMRSATGSVILFFDSAPVRCAFM